MGAEGPAAARWVEMPWASVCVRADQRHAPIAATRSFGSCVGGACLERPSVIRVRVWAKSEAAMRSLANVTGGACLEVAMRSVAFVCGRQEAEAAMRFFDGRAWAVRVAKWPPQLGVGVWAARVSSSGAGRTRRRRTWCARRASSRRCCGRCVAPSGHALLPRVWALVQFEVASLAFAVWAVRVSKWP